MPEGPGPGPRLLLSVLGLGRSPVAPGTVASIATAAMLYVAAQAGSLNGWVAAGGLLLFGCLTSLAWGGLPVSASGRGDPGWVVADEVAGQSIASAAAVAAGGWPAHVLALLLFRVFDILKPPPVRQAEALPGGLGVLLDDLVAGLLAAALTYAAWRAGLLDHLA